MNNTFYINEKLPSIKSQILNSHNPIKIILFGNNPGELGTICQHLKTSRRRFEVEAIFKTNNFLRKVNKYQPDCILLDESSNQELVKEILDIISTDYRTSKLPITILRRENSPKIYYSAVQTYLIKEKMTKEGITDAILKSIKSKKNQRYFYTTYSSNYSFFWGTFTISKSKVTNLLVFLKKWISWGDLVRE
jgi:PleD family two-component response regulator